MMYPFSRLFSTPSYAFVILSCANVFLGTVSTMATFILEALQDDDAVRFCASVLLTVIMVATAVETISTNSSFKQFLVFKYYPNSEAKLLSKFIAQHHFKFIYNINME